MGFHHFELKSIADDGKAVAGVCFSHLPHCRKVQGSVFEVVLGGEKNQTNKKSSLMAVYNHPFRSEMY